MSGKDNTSPELPVLLRCRNMAPERLQVGNERGLVLVVKDNNVVRLSAENVFACFRILIPQPLLVQKSYRLGPNRLANLIYQFFSLSVGFSEHVLLLAV